MIYHTWSLVGLMLWVRYALLGLKPWLPLRVIYARYLESPGTKAYSVAEARKLFADFSQVEDPHRADPWGPAGVRRRPAPSWGAADACAEAVA